MNGKVWLCLLLGLVVVGCRNDDGVEPTAIVAPIATSPIISSSEPELAEDTVGDINFITIAIDAPSRFQDFADIDEFGNVVGFDADVMADLAADLDLDYEFVVTPFNGLLSSVSNREFDVAMSALVIPDQPEEGIVYTVPYLEVGQVLVVRANETELQSYRDVGPSVPIGVQRFTSGEQTARDLLGLSEPALQLFESTPDALQALIDGQVQGVVIDSDDALHFTTSYPQQLKIAGGEGKAAWISRKEYGIATSSENERLLELLDAAILQANGDGTIERLTRAWLIPEETINAGESLVGTPANELVIGIVGQLEDVDPAAEPDLIGWEVKINVMSGLLMYDAENNLVPVLAADFPLISEDKLEYTLDLRPGLTFPDGSEFSADDVKFSINRAARLGSFAVNSYLKDDNEDNFADDDAVQVIDTLTVKFILEEPTSYFPSLLATPPYFIISQDCFSANFDPDSICGGIGAYTITEWEGGIHIRFKANPRWPGPAPAFENIQLRFYEDSSRMRRSLENSAIDIAWTGLSPSDFVDLRDASGLLAWEGPPAFKSYLVFEQSSEPWDDVRVRQAVAYAVDREAIASEVFQDGRQPLYSPVPRGAPGHVDSEPIRDLNQARSLLTAAGFNPERKAEITIWFVNDDRYTILEEAYAQALKSQLEETELIEVELLGAPWDIFRPQSLTCNYPAYLLGWPSSGQPVAFVEAMSWMEYFITNTSRICSNFESAPMQALFEEALEETDSSARLELYRQMQLLWAEEFPTLDLTQEPRMAVSLTNVQSVVVDALGLLHYDLLSKTGASGQANSALVTG